MRTEYRELWLEILESEAENSGPVAILFSNVMSNWERGESPLSSCSNCYKGSVFNMSMHFTFLCIYIRSSLTTSDQEI